MKPCLSNVTSNRELVKPGEGPLPKGQTERTISRQVLRHELRREAKKELAKTYGFYSMRGNLHYAAKELTQFPRRARRRVVMGIAKRWYHTIREELQHKVLIPASALERFKQSMLPAWLRNYALPTASGSSPITSILQTATGSARTAWG